MRHDLKTFQQLPHLTGRLLWIGNDASVQFGGTRGLRARIAGRGWTYGSTPDGWLYLSVYTYTPGNDRRATGQRTILVQPAGIHVISVDRPAHPAPAAARRKVRAVA